MDGSNGKTQEIGRRYKNSGIETQRAGMGEAGFSSPESRIESLLSDRENRDGGNINWKLTPIRDTTAGKILERLEVVEKKHLEYLHSHRSRLQARLGENIQEEEEFLRESNQIKSDIYHLAVAQQQETNGNGHQ